MRKIEEETKVEIYDAICNLQEEIGKFEINFENMKDTEIIDAYRYKINDYFDDLDDAIARAEYEMQEEY